MKKLTTKKLELRDLTKDELIKIIRWNIPLCDIDIWRARWESLTKKAQDMRDKSLSIEADADNYDEMAKAGDEMERVWQEGELYQKQADEFYGRREAYQ